LGFRVCGIWPLNFDAMVGKFGPIELFITAKEKDLGNSYHSNTIVQTNENEDEVKVAT
jgi:hypothetical protein